MVRESIRGLSRLGVDAQQSTDQAANGCKNCNIRNWFNPPAETIGPLRRRNKPIRLERLAEWNKKKRRASAEEVLLPYEPPYRPAIMKAQAKRAVSRVRRGRRRKKAKTPIHTSDRVTIPEGSSNPLFQKGWPARRRSHLLDSNVAAYESSCSHAGTMLGTLTREL